MIKWSRWFPTMVLAAILIAGSVSLDSAAFADDKKDKEKEKPKMLFKKYSKVQKKSGTIKETLDIDNDGLTDLDIAIKKPKNPTNPFKVTYQISDSCVDGNTHDNATMKLGFTNPAFDFRDRNWLTQGFEVWNRWFLSESTTDPNHRIDLISIPNGTVPFPYPTSGDDVIQKNPEDKKGSFKHKSHLGKFEGQGGWKGVVFFTGPPGDYFFWTIFPSQGLDAPCDTVAAEGFEITIDPVVDNNLIDDLSEDDDE